MKPKRPICPRDGSEMIDGNQMESEAAQMRRAQIAAIHVRAKQLGLQEDVYRALILKITGGKNCAGALNSGERIAVLDEMRRLIEGHAWAPPRLRTVGDAPGGAPAPGAPGAAQLAKIHALWNELRKAGALKDPSERALRLFARRITGRDALAWLSADDANKTIEGLKSWLARTPARPQ